MHMHLTGQHAPGAQVTRTETLLDLPATGVHPLVEVRKPLAMVMVQLEAQLT